MKMIKNKINILLVFSLFQFIILSAHTKTKINTEVKLPSRGICAHRGANETHPENTIPAFREAIYLGAHMIEFDVRMTRDKKLVVIHDKTVDRTTNGTGLVSELTLEEIKKLDAGSWKSEKFTGEKVPTLKETLEIMPDNIWLNIHLKGDEKLGLATAKVLVSEGRINQGIIACGADAANGVKKINPNIMICNMERQGNREEYVEETIQAKFPFIQLLKKRDDKNLENDINRLKKKKIKINYYYGDTKKEVKELFKLGVDFVLTNNLKEMLYVAESIGIERSSNKTYSFPKPKHGKIYVVAHRGVHIGIPENTIEAYKRAIELGCDFIEIDLRKSKDGRFVSVHNSTLNEYTNGLFKGRVNDYTLNELKTMNIGSRISEKWNNERIPTFEEILELCKGQIGIYLDLKEPDVKAQVEIIKSYGMESNIIWYIPASHMDVIKRLMKNSDKTFPMPDPGAKENIAKIFNEVHPHVIATDMGELNEVFMDIAKKYNLKVIVDEDKGTVDEWEKIISWGTDGIQTDDPEKLLKYLKKRNYGTKKK